MLLSGHLRVGRSRAQSCGTAAEGPAGRWRESRGAGAGFSTIRRRAELLVIARSDIGRHDPPMLRGIRIRTAECGDAAAVRELLRASYAALLAGHYDAELASEASSSSAEHVVRLLPSGRYYVAEHDACVVGCGGWSWDSSLAGVDRPHTAMIRAFAVEPGWTRRGIAGAIFRRCLAAAESAGAEWLAVRSSINAEPFYASLGFASLHPLKVTLPSGRAVDAVLMELELSGEAHVPPLRHVEEHRPSTRGNGRSAAAQDRARPDGNPRRTSDREGA